MSSPVVTHAYDSLCAHTPCRVCDLLDTLVAEHPPDVAFYEDYALLCLYALHCPVTWTGAAIAAHDFHRIVAAHFGALAAHRGLYRPGFLLPLDVGLHFFVKQCFCSVATGELLQRDNMHFYTLEALRAILTGAPTLSVSPRTANFRDAGVRVSAAERTKALEALRPFFREGGCTGSSFLPLLFGAWEGTEVVPPEARGGGAIGPDPGPAAALPEDADVAQGPCLLAPLLCVKIRNRTCSVCLPCELLAAHPEAEEALRALRATTLDSYGNNIKLLERIHLSLKQRTAFPSVRDPDLGRALGACTAQQLHKHLFCDPLCALNARTAAARLIFSEPVPSSLRLLRASLATGQYLTGTVAPPMQALVYIFKATQYTKMGKTLVQDIIKELQYLLAEAGIQILGLAQTQQNYL